MSRWGGEILSLHVTRYRVETLLNERTRYVSIFIYAFDFKQLSEHRKEYQDTLSWNEKCAEVDSKHTEKIQG